MNQQASPVAPEADAGAATPGTELAAGEAAAALEADVLRDRVIAVLRDVYDPEIPVNIYDLGLIYGLDLSQPGHVDIEMTLTSPACPVAGTLPPEIEDRVAEEVEGVTTAKTHLVWEPPWSPERMSEEAKLELGF
jgi:FeS assembly SUF system protein